MNKSISYILANNAMNVHMPLVGNQDLSVPLFGSIEIVRANISSYYLKLIELYWQLRKFTELFSKLQRHPVPLQQLSLELFFQNQEVGGLH